METRFERKYVISETPVASLLAGHDNPTIQNFARLYLRGLLEKLEDTKAEIEIHRARRQFEQDDFGANPPLYKKSSPAEQNLARYASYASDPPRVSQKALAEARAIVGLQAQSNTLRLSLRALDHFLVSIMHGRIKPGQEAFAASLTTLIFTLSSVPESAAPALVLYIHLVCGDPRIPRQVPYSLARRHGLFSSELAAIEKNAQERSRAQFAQELEKKWARYHSEEARVASNRKKRKDELTECVLYQLQNWRHPHALYDYDIVQGCHLIERTADLVKAYVPYAASAKVREILSPFKFTRFCGAWANNFPEIDALLAKISEALAQMRVKNEEVKNGNRWWSLFLNSQPDGASGYPRPYWHKHDRSLNRSIWNGPRPKEEIQKTRVYFQTPFLLEFERFICNMRETALVYLLLLETVDKDCPAYHRSSAGNELISS